MIRPDDRLVGQDWKLRKREENLTLRELRSRTGGAYNRRVAPQLLEFAWIGYLLGIQIPPTLDKPKTWKLQLRGDADKTHKNALIYYAAELTPCSQAVSAR
jgi:hypothetical protein